LPQIAPGQLWLVEAPAVKEEPSAPARHALDGANVVIYDRMLGTRLAHALPLGTYAEPAPEHGSGAAASRCVSFARDGWSVVRLMPPRLAQRDRARRIREVVAELAAARVPGLRPVTVLAEAACGIREETATTLDRLADTVATYDHDTRLAIVIDAFGGGAAGLPPVAANGLAG
jgi:siroheme synthase